MPSDDKLEVYIFYSPYCPRCRPMKELVRQAKRVFGRRSGLVFYWMNTDKPSVQTIMRRKYPCISRIPTVVCRGDIYWVGIPEKRDFIGILAYLKEHPGGGKGAYGYE